MRPMMLRALSAAEANDDKGGLLYTVGGWITARAAFEYHNNSSVNALIDSGCLWEYGKGKQRKRCITDHGRRKLADERERLARRRA